MSARQSAEFDAEDVIGLADGRDVPKVCVEALDRLAERWPGSTWPAARAAVAAAVLEAIGFETRVTPSEATHLGEQS